MNKNNQGWKFIVKILQSVIKCSPVTTVVPGYQSFFHQSKNIFLQRKRYCVYFHVYTLYRIKKIWSFSHCLHDESIIDFKKATFRLLFSVLVNVLPGMEGLSARFLKCQTLSNIDIPIVHIVTHILILWGWLCFDILCTSRVVQHNLQHWNSLFGKKSFKSPAVCFCCITLFLEAGFKLTALYIFCLVIVFQSRLRKQDVGLKTHLQQLDQQISELKLDVSKASTDQLESDSRPSSGV